MDRLITPDIIDTERGLARDKFKDPRVTVDGQVRARVELSALKTLWFNTGTLCNIACASCYIESSPTNDRLSYLTRADVVPFLNEIEEDGYPTQEIGLTGGEPFMNPHIAEILEEALGRGYSVLVLTNAMQPMMRPRIQKMLIDLTERYGERLVLRVSLDHYTEALHESERGAGTWAIAWKGIRWLAEQGIFYSIAGRTCWDESEVEARSGYRALFAREGLPFDVARSLVLFPEMDAKADVPEITDACWDILGKEPAAMMCATSRMVVKRKGASSPVVLPCTLLPYDLRFEMGTSLSDGRASVPLNHPHCAKFCVLGGGSCSQS